MNYQMLIEARDNIQPYMDVTPMLSSPLLDKHMKGSVFMKADCLCPTGAFKLRGAINAVSTLSHAQKQAGVVAFSTGNHARAVAYAGLTFGVRSVIIMPKTANAVKIENTRLLGADVVLFDPETETREAIAEHYEKEQGLSLIRPYDHPEVIAGQGTSGLEMVDYCLSRHITPDYCYVPASGGGYLAGVSIAIAKHFPRCEIVGVESDVSRPWFNSMNKGQRTHYAQTGPSICDAILPPHPMPGELTWPIVKGNVTRFIAASDDEVRASMNMLESYLGLATEPCGAITLAAALTDGERREGKQILCVVSGRNRDFSAQS
ncbi:serine/threonine dehydratase [Enterovibrio norvegicus]|uniref:threonine ammonia-lyase n=1 Tax=Enterovibrio norvegicus TaxID=188144 RepID=UPI000C829E1D|nr:threonine/serine dehydratase [Enterovibrio norvegicus]MCC4796765.1 threonine/serine dehydratase [Enterovibrio norvegicus]PMI37344.1 serine/threonine dehydratase [Enterovibrio norvegicus]PMN49935.1 serine/threonine dehydratase [Enterovibrio norvegicus]TKF37041.1 threonine/serine dehydratase [Enterovibrio norvegicus]